jgi:hypothetical protein
MYRPGKLAGKPDILSRELGDSPYEGEMKYQQNRGCILLPAEMFEISTAEIMKLQIDRELLNEIKDKTARDWVMQDIITKFQNGKQKDNRVTWGLCHERDGLLIYEGLLWVLDHD